MSKRISALLKSLKDIVTIRPNGLDESFLDIKEGRVNYAKDVKDLISQCSK